MKNRMPFAPRPIWEQILQYAVIPTFDLVITIPGGGVVIVRRRIAPYKNVWALPGLRMMKSEAIGDTLVRIASSEVGLPIDVASSELLGQYVGRFRTEGHRQDLSTGYAVRALSANLKLNVEHFTAFRIIRRLSDVPPKTGAMYRFYLQRYFSGTKRSEEERFHLSAVHVAAG